MFDIDITTLAISAAALIAFILPFYYAGRTISKKQALVLSQLENLAQSQNLTFAIKDLWRNQYFIGLDSTKGILMYCENLTNSSPVVLDLKKIKNVTIDETAHVVTNLANSNKVIDKLSLFIVDNRNRIIQDLEFYDADKYSDLNGEAVLIKKWEILIREQIKIHTSKLANV